MDILHLKTRLINFYPPLLLSGIKVIERTPDYRYFRVRLKLRFWNKNLFGTQFGGALFTLTDPFYPMMLLHNLQADGFFLTDKAAHIRYLKPGRTDVTAEFRITEDDLAFIRKNVNEHGQMDWSHKVEIKDTGDRIIAEVERVIYISKRKHIKQTH
jgi:acyl-coenzyme A thioesterase PaaI-like protein